MWRRKSVARPFTLRLSLTPIQPIEQNADGSGGGITCRLHVFLAIENAVAETGLVDIVWGEKTEVTALEGMKLS